MEGFLQLLVIFVGFGYYGAEDLRKLNFRLIYSLDKNVKYSLNKSSDILKDPKFNNNIKTVIYTSGYTETFTTASNQGIISAYLQRTDFNILIFDWGDYSNGNYLTVAHTTSQVFEF
jgi:hypothetical protein